MSGVCLAGEDVELQMDGELESGDGKAQSGSVKRGGIFIGQLTFRPGKSVVVASLQCPLSSISSNGLSIKSFHISVTGYPSGSVLNLSDNVAWRVIWSWYSCSPSRCLEATMACGKAC